MEDANSNINYSKWLNNELSDKELKILEESGDLEILTKIISEVDTWEMPAVKETYDGLKLKIEHKNKKGKVVSMYKILAVAASVLLLVGIGFKSILFDSEITYASNFGEIKKITFPDGTKAVLNGNSTISFIEDDWNTNRIVQLNGQAYFNIDIKGGFEVQINGGSVNVLGKKFDILTREDYNNIKGFEGTVAVKTQQINDTIIKGVGIDSENKPFDLQSRHSNWVNNYSKFNNAKLIEVIGALTLKYGIKIDYSNINIIDKRFTGQFSNLDPDLALEMVFKPLGISYDTLNGLVVLK